MAFNIQAFKSEGLTFNGARPTLFDVEISTNPLFNDTSFAQKHRFLIKATSLPASTVDSVEVPYFGRKIKYAGDRVFANWAVTVMNDEDFVLRRAFERWHAHINSIVPNEMSLNAIDGINYKTNAVVRQYSKAGPAEGPIAAYYFSGLFPVAVQGIALDWDATNQIEQFEVEFAYDYWIPGTSDQNDGGTLDFGPISAPL